MKARDRVVRALGAIAAAATLAGCATLLGIADDYGSQDETDAGNPAGTSATTGNGGGGSSSSGTSGASGGSGKGGSGGSESIVDAGVEGGGGQGPSGAGGARDAGNAGAGGASGGSAGTGGAGGGTGGTAGKDGGGGSGGTASGGTGGTGGAGGTGGKGGAGGSGGVPDAGRVSPILRVQHGLTTLAAGAATQKVTIAQVDLTKSFVVFGTRFDSAAPVDSQVSGQLTSPTEVTFMRAGQATSPALPIQYYVAEFQSGITVQRGTTAMTATSVPTPIASVDLSKTFPLVSYRNTGTNYGKDDFVRAKLTGAAQLTLENAQASPTGIVEWQVISFDGAKVQSGDLAIPDADTQLTVPVMGVDPTKTWLVTSYDLATFTSGAGQLMIRGKVDSATQLGFRRLQGGAGGTLSWYAVTFTNGTTVQSATTNFTELVMTASPALTAVDPAKSIVTAAGLWQRGGATAIATAASPGFATFTLDVGTGSPLTVMRGAAMAGAPAAVDWYAVSFF